MQINWSLDVWNIILIAAFAFGLWGKMTSMETKVNAMWHHFVSDRRAKLIEEE